MVCGYQDLSAKGFFLRDYNLDLNLLVNINL